MLILNVFVYIFVTEKSTKFGIEEQTLSVNEGLLLWCPEYLLLKTIHLKEINKNNINKITKCAFLLPEESKKKKILTTLLNGFSKINSWVWKKKHVNRMYSAGWEPWHWQGPDWHLRYTEKWLHWNFEQLTFYPHILENSPAPKITTKLS